MPPADQVRDALQRILSSEVFARSERARDLLRYLVDQDLAGHADRLKGFSIAVDVFGRTETFDPATDTVVRVQAGRLRDLLEQYYAGEGRDDPLRIAVPRGTYVPGYKMLADTPVPVEPASVAPQPPSAEPALSRRRAAPFSMRRLSLAAGLGLAVLLAAAVIWQILSPAVTGDGEAVAANAVAQTPAEGGGEFTGSVATSLLPYVFLDIEGGDYGGARVETALRRGLAAFDTIHFIARPPDPEEPGMRRRTDFVFTVEEGLVPGEVHLELQNVVSGKVLLSRNVLTDDRAQSAIDDEIADILTSVAPVSGIIYASLVESGAQTALARCLALNEAFYRNQSPQAHGEAYRCLEQLAMADLKTVLIYSELASLHMQAIVSRYEYPREPTPGQALDYARAAIQLAPNSPYAHRSMGYVLSRTASREEALRWTRRAYELNTFDLGMAASYGYALVFDGDYEEGTPILQRAVSAASSHPTWWDYGLFLGHFMLDDMQAAANAVSALASSRRAHYVAARLLAAAGTGADGEARTLLDELLADHPNFARDPDAFFRRGNYPPQMTIRLVEALRAAGLAGAS